MASGRLSPKPSGETESPWDVQTEATPALAQVLVYLQGPQGAESGSGVQAMACIRPSGREEAWGLGLPGFTQPGPQGAGGQGLQLPPASRMSVGQCCTQFFFINELLEELLSCGHLEDVQGLPRPLSRGNLPGCLCCPLPKLLG